MLVDAMRYFERKFRPSWRLIMYTFEKWEPRDSNSEYKITCRRRAIEFQTNECREESSTSTASELIKSERRKERNVLFWGWKIPSFIKLIRANIVKPSNKSIISNIDRLQDLSEFQPLTLCKKIQENSDVQMPSV